MTDKNALSTKVRSLLSRYAKARGALRPPIDPENMADLCSVLSIEHRPMVPEGVLTPVPGGFRIYLQSNFTNQSGTNFRRRFTLAHELVHTFFYDRNVGVPRRVRGSPRGSTLERLCHMGASQILVPDVLLRQALRPTGQVESAESILKLARLFSVSVEVMVRRLHELGLVAGEKFAAILVDSGNGSGRRVQAACFGTLLRCNASPPKPGSDFDTWVLQLLPPSGSALDTEWKLETQSATITAKRVLRSKRSFILELRFGPPSRYPDARLSV